MALERKTHREDAEKKEKPKDGREKPNPVLGNTLTGLHGEIQKVEKRQEKLAKEKKDFKEANKRTEKTLESFTTPEAREQLFFALHYAKHPEEAKKAKISGTPQEEQYTAALKKFDSAEGSNREEAYRFLHEERLYGAKDALCGAEKNTLALRQGFAKDLAGLRDAVPKYAEKAQEVLGSARKEGEKFRHLAELASSLRDNGQRVAAAKFLESYRTFEQELAAQETEKNAKQERLKAEEAQREALSRMEDTRRAETLVAQIPESPEREREPNT